MRHLARTLREVFWMLCMCVLLLPHAAAADPLLTVDLDGDGRRDQVTLDLREPSVLRIWLSASGQTQAIRTRVPLLQVVVADLDGDHRPELIARDSDSQIHVWKRKRRGFHSFRPRHAALEAVEQRDFRSFDYKDGVPLGEVTSTSFTPFALTLCPLPRAPALEVTPARLSHVARAGRSFTAVDPFAPRPPPTPIPL